MMIRDFIFQGSRYQLKLEWGISLVFSSIFLLCCALAIWQWQKAQNYSSAIANQALHKTSLNLQGKWLQQQFLLDNRTHKGRVGYYQLGLFATPGSRSLLLVNLGWLPASVIRSDIPTPFLPEGLQDVYIQALPSHKTPNWNNQHWAAPKGKDWPKRIQGIDLQRMQLLVKQPIEEGMWLLRDGKGKKTAITMKDGYLSKHKHLGYALQWLLIGLAAILVCLANAIRKVGNVR